MTTKKTTKPRKTEKKEETTQEKQSFDVNKDLKFGFISGLKQDDNFLFETFGTERSLVNLMGVKHYTDKRVEGEINKNLNTGDALTFALFQSVTQLSTKMDRLLSLLEKPTNQLE
jgi:hypothetical protein